MSDNVKQITVHNHTYDIMDSAARELLGDTDISDIGDGTVTGNVTELQGNVTELQGNVTELQGNVTELDNNKVSRSGDTMTGNLTVNATKNDSAAWVKVVDVWSGTASASLHAGSGGYNRGIYDETLGKWMLYTDQYDDVHLGTATVGSGTKPMYLSSGVPTASSSTVGSGTKPMYLSSGTLTASSSTVGSGTKPMYLSSGTLTASSSTVGSGTIPMYLSSGTLTASSSTVGSGTKPMYLSSGTLTASSSTVGSGTKPMYLSSGTLTASSSTVGSGTIPMYLSSGTLTASSSTVGGAAKPVYMNSGTITACSNTVGGAAKPVYMSSGTITACSNTVGNARTPVYMSSGTITACSNATSFTAGETFNIVFYGAGYVTNSGEDVHFTMSIGRTFTSVNAVAVSGSLGTLRLRQDKNYCYGGSSGTSVTPSSVTISNSTNGLLWFTLHFDSNTSDVVNNAAIGIELHSTTLVLS